MDDKLYQVWMWILTVVVVPLLTVLGTSVISLRERMAVMEKQKTVDPVTFTEMATSMASSMRYMAEQVKELKTNQQELRDLMMELAGKERGEK